MYPRGFWLVKTSDGLSSFRTWSGYVITFTGSGIALSTTLNTCPCPNHYMT
jgi:hypothetical protein